MTTIIRIVFFACAIIVGWFGGNYAYEAVKNRDATAVVWTVAATWLVCACLIDWAIERRRA